MQRVKNPSRRAVEVAANLYRSGLSLRVVEAQTGVGREYVRKALKATGEIRPRLAFQDNPETRYEKRIEKTASGCWIFHGPRNNMGYGMVSAGGNPMLAHRFFYQQVNGPIPAGMDACHRCDNPACCNPDHIFIGTRTDNMRDAVAKGRVRRGETSAQARFSESDVLDMRRRHCAGETTGEIGRRYDTSYKTVWAIVHRKAWGHI